MAISLRELIVAAPRGSCKEFLQRAAVVFAARQHNTRGLLFFNQASEEPKFFVTGVRERRRCLGRSARGADHGVWTGWCAALPGFLKRNKN
jgi:hypothetical protein